MDKILLRRQRGVARSKGAGSVSFPWTTAVDRIRQQAGQGRYPRDDLNVRHTAPEAVALSGLSYGGTDDSDMLCTIAIPSKIGNFFVTPAQVYALRQPHTCATHIGNRALQESDPPVP